MRTHYDNLNVTEDAPQEVIRAAYRALSQMHHPDKRGGHRHALHKMQTLNEAYDILSDARKRADYDGELHRLRHPASGANESPQPAWHHVRAGPRRPEWLKSLLLVLSDARFVFPIVALIWWIVYRRLAHM